MQVDWKLAVDLVKSIAWPLVAVFAFFLFREPLGKLMTEFVLRADRLAVSFSGLSLEVATLKEYSKPIPFMRDLKGASSKEDICKISELISSPLQADYIIIDLGSGEEWLTSRLFLFALLMDLVAKLQIFVFVENFEGIRGRFLGTATPSDVWKSLARQYPWLEEALYRAAKDCYDDEYTVLNSPPIRYEDKEGVRKFADKKTIFAIFDKKNEVMHTKFIWNFYDKVTRKTLPPMDEINQHYKFDDQEWEKGCLINRGLLQEDLESVLNYSWCVESCDKSRGTIEIIIQQKESFIPLVDQDRRFKRLIDRYDLLDQIARNS